MVEHLTAETFRSKVFDYTTNKEWKFAGTRPALIDFYASWCGPCKMLAPILEELKKEYDGKIDIYKVNTEEEQELSHIFGIKSIPSMLFIPMGETPQMASGAIPKEQLKQVFADVLKVS